MKVLVLCGGASSERVVSLASGDAVAKWISSLGHDVVKYDPERPHEQFTADQIMAPQAIGVDAPAFECPHCFELRVVRGLLDIIEREKIELVFPILHGGYGEDGSVQSLLEWVGVSYTGSGPRSCANAMHKPTAKSLLMQAGIPLAAGFSIDESGLDKIEAIAARIEKEIGYPAIVKPQSGGSTVGLSVVSSAVELPNALLRIREQSDGALIERFFNGREIAATVVDGVAFPLVEIKPKEGFYDYSNKYTPGRTDYVCPAEIPTELMLEMQACATRVFRTLDARGFARIDFLLNEKEFICLELNSLPGMTATSLVPKAAHAHGWTAEQLITRIMDCACKPSELISA